MKAKSLKTRVSGISSGMGLAGGSGQGWAEALRLWGRYQGGHLIIRCRSFLAFGDVPSLQQEGSPLLPAFQPGHRITDPGPEGTSEATESNAFILQMKKLSHFLDQLFREGHP